QIDRTIVTPQTVRCRQQAHVAVERVVLEPGRVHAADSEPISQGEAETRVNELYRRRKARYRGGRDCGRGRDRGRGRESRRARATWRRCARRRCGWRRRAG